MSLARRKTVSGPSCWRRESNPELLGKQVFLGDPLCAGSEVHRASRLTSSPSLLSHALAPPHRSPVLALVVSHLKRSSPLGIGATAAHARAPPESAPRAFHGSLATRSSSVRRLRCVRGPRRRSFGARAFRLTRAVVPPARALLLLSALLITLPCTCAPAAHPAGVGGHDARLRRHRCGLPCTLTATLARLPRAYYLPTLHSYPLHAARPTSESSTGQSPGFFSSHSLYPRNAIHPRTLQFTSSGLNSRPSPSPTALALVTVNPTRLVNRDSPLNPLIIVATHAAPSTIAMRSLGNVIVELLCLSPLFSHPCAPPFPSSRSYVSSLARVRASLRPIVSSRTPPPLRCSVECPVPLRALMSGDLSLFCSALLSFHASPEFTCVALRELLTFM
ncbi:hypothetical protein DFH09DRAFT_1362425 [Mycena vulgaris]|nr:hypothetical protein DFH09DRAFT_1362425 [Mycena vulgaris]